MAAETRIQQEIKDTNTDWKKDKSELLSWLTKLEPKDIIESLNSVENKSAIIGIIKTPTEEAIKDLQTKKLAEKTGTPTDLSVDEKDLLVLSARLNRDDLILPTIKDAKIDQTAYDKIIADELIRLWTTQEKSDQNLDLKIEDITWFKIYWARNWVSAPSKEDVVSAVNKISDATNKTAIKEFLKNSKITELQAYLIDNFKIKLYGKNDGKDGLFWPGTYNAIFNLWVIKEEEKKDPSLEDYKPVKVEPKDTKDKQKEPKDQQKEPKAPLDVKKLTNILKNGKLKLHDIQSSNIKFETYSMNDMLDFFDKDIKNKILIRMNTIKTKYWIDIDFTAKEITNILDWKNKYWINLLSPDQLIPQLDMVIKEFEIYPNNFIKNSWIKTIALTEWPQRLIWQNVFNWNNESAWFYGNSNFIVVWSFKSNQDEITLHHEFYHLLDSKKDWMTRDDSTRKKLWNGYISSYASKSPIEDQSETAEFIIKKTKQILNKAKTNNSIKMKIEVMTWCKINNNFTWFEKDYTDTEFKNIYSKYWFNNKEYYSKRSNWSINYKRRNDRVVSSKSV